MILTNKDLRIITYDKQFKIIRDITSRQHVHQEGTRYYTKTELNQQPNQNEKDLQAVTYDREHTIMGKPLGQGSTANVYRYIDSEAVTTIMSNKRHGQESIEVIMAREIEWFKAQDRKYQAFKDGLE